MTSRAARKRAVAGEWEALRNVLETAFVVTAERQRGFVARTPAGEEIIIERASGEISEWLVIRVAICPCAEMDAEATLQRNDTLAFAAIVLCADMYRLRVAFPFGAPELHDPLRLIRSCVDAARSLAPTRVVPAADAYRLFLHYAD